MTTKITEKNISNIANAAVQWQSVVVADGSTGLTAVAGRGYFINTTSGAQTVTFPASPTAGDTIVINDYASTFATNNVTINFNGNKLEADTANALLQTNDQTHTFVFTDATQGWKIINQDTSAAIQPAFISATGGTVTTDGNFKIHTFTGDDTFVVSSLGNAPTVPSGGPSTVDYLVVAGGGGGGYDRGGGGGAGGFRESKDSTVNSPHTASPLAASTGITVTATSYPITVGAGSGGGGGPSSNATAGSNSVFSTITSAGGAGGGIWVFNGTSGGSGSGASGTDGPPIDPPARSGGAGNTPPVSPPQGNNGGNGNSINQNSGAGGGGGAGGVGSNGANNAGGAGGAGVGTGINPSPTVGTPGPSPTIRYFAGGGGGGADLRNGGTGGLGGSGGGSAGGPAGGGPTGNAGVANTGGGGAGGVFSAPFPGAPQAAGKGIVIIRYKFQ